MLKHTPKSETENAQQATLRTERPLLFIDVDGTLTANYGSPKVLQPRPLVGSILKWATDNFDCYWLTGWASESLVHVGFLMPGSGWECIQYAHWHPNKTDAIYRIAVDREWFWLDDDPTNEETKILQASNDMARFCFVAADEVLGLKHAILELSFKASLPIPHF